MTSIEIEKRGVDNGTTSDDSGVRRKPFSIEASWTVTTPSDWRAYKESLKREVSPAYVVQRDDGDLLQFTRVLDFDRLILVMERISNGPPLRVRITLTGNSS